ncbi:unnamed protein product [Sphagnum troendelagicum]|uniref:Uncharacterized protein n=1 Tax=Sphagnum troendelagicum TaxID=128251 RepID=A0ABP0ULR2_9BRYO
MVPMVGWIRRRGWGHSSWLVTVITLLAILGLHDMLGVVGTRLPRELLLQNCFKDQNEISKCIQEAQFHLRHPLHNTPPYLITYPPIQFARNTTGWPVTQSTPPPSYPIQSPSTQVAPHYNATWPPTPPPQ